MYLINNNTNVIRLIKMTLFCIIIINKTIVSYNIYIYIYGIYQLSTHTIEDYHEYIFTYKEEKLNLYFLRKRGRIK